MLSAVEGLEVSAPELQFRAADRLVVIVALFAVQSRGTGRVGRVFGPVMVVWFVIIGLLGAGDRAAPLRAAGDVAQLRACASASIQGWLAFFVLGAVVLCVTGAEALYADMGHFGARPIRIAWLVFVLPCLVLNYFGQGALVLRIPSAIDNPFFLLGPTGCGCRWCCWPPWPP